jgi:hypothetical protein
MNTLAKDFKAAFGSVWALLGVIMSAVAVFNWLSSVLKIGLSALFQQLLTSFRSVFHPVIEAITGWVIPWLPFLALPEWKDGLVLWFAVGGAVARTSVMAQLRQNTIDIAPLNPPAMATFVIANSVTCLILWPLYVVSFAIRPIAFSKNAGRLIIFETSKALERKDINFVYDHDRRTVFAMQPAAVTAVVITLILLNAAGVG